PPVRISLIRTMFKKGRTSISTPVPTTGLGKGLQKMPRLLSLVGAQETASRTALERAGYWKWTSHTLPSDGDRMLSSTKVMTPVIRCGRNTVKRIGDQSAPCHT